MREKTIFERIVAGELPCNKVLEDNDFLAFHDIHPRAPIHILAIPKKHFKDFQEFDPELMAKMTLFIQKLAVLLGLDKSGYRLISNCGKNSGQEVFHLHFHILGGFELPKDKAEQANPQALF
ncbi:histidine triad nucleotide-binding protein [Campylobacter sp.]|uniref:histidine triad nucleotide-binding protein n=1 Tax=Campylobacter sp. TaxID=205 RepID=UPI0026DCA31B|nr:histidine triad nucleotide-binding protein [Campylobacter sp.]MDO4674252.1 histidine triad nucleotide-binding protein [Campylobacter sp.]